ncbi:MAG TPA: sigma-70 family RNA polymerase sigma factor [Puia sp.]
MNDQMILELIRTDQNDRALDALYRHFPMIRKLIRSNGGDRQDAEDVFQEALIILIRKVKGSEFRLTAQLSTYLYSVCKYVWKDELKKRNRELPLNFEIEPGIEATIEDESRARLAEQVIAELKDRCRELLLFFYEGRLKLQEIAERMGYSSGNTAKNQKYKCLEAARDRLKELTSTLHHS